MPESGKGFGNPLAPGVIRKEGFMGNVQDFLFPILGAHLSLMFGGLAYACKYCDRNSLFGVQTAYTMRNDENWREVNDRVAHVLPPFSAVAGLVALSGFPIPAMRNAYVMLAVISAQLLVATIAICYKPK
jgi:hypothetical protein